MSDKRQSTTATAPVTYTLMPKEIKTAIRWAFRALGIPAGYARHAGEMVLYYEILRGKGISYLTEMLRENQGSWAAADLGSKEGQKATLDARNGHSLLVMPGIFEFAYAEAKLSGQPFSIEIYNVGQGVQLVEQLVYSIAQRGLTCAWIPREGTRFVANQDQICSYLPVARQPSVKTTQAVLSVGITTKFKKLDHYTCVTTETIRQNAIGAEKNGIEIPALLWETVDRVAKQVLVKGQEEG